MINKLPVVGKSYRLKNYIDDFWDYFEELPEDNLQQTEKVQIGQTYRHLENGYNYKLAGIDSGDNAICIMLDEKGNKIVPIRNVIPKVNEFWLTFAKNKTPNSVEKGEISESEVGRSLEELKREIALCGGGIKPAETEGEKQISRVFYYFLEKAQNLVNALESERSEKAIMSKPEPEIDMKQERVEPVSIWKDVSELPRNNKHCLVKANDANKNSVILSVFKAKEKDKGNSGFIDMSDSCAMNYAKKYCTLTDFINSFEQMQKDIEELKRK